MTPYRPSGSIDPVSGLLVLVSALIIGVLVGGLANVIGQFFRLIILFPLGMGLAVGFVGAFVINWRRVQAPLIAGLIGCLGGVAAWTADMAFDYVRQRSALHSQVASMVDSWEGESDDTLPRDRIGQAVNDILVRWGKGQEVSPGQVYANLVNEQIQVGEGELVLPAPDSSSTEAVSGWVRSRVNEGTTIGRAGRSSDSSIGATGTMILWGLEILLCGGIAAGMLYGAAKEPLCEACNEWYADSGGVVPIAGVDAKGDLIEAVERGDSSRLSAIAVKEGLSLPVVGLRFRSCPKCEHAPVFAQVVTVRAGRKGEEEKVVKTGLLQPAVARDLLAALDSGSDKVEQDAQSAV